MRCLFLLLCVFCLRAVPANSCSALKDGPRVVLGTSAFDVVATPPIARDYDQQIRRGDPFEIVRGLPLISQNDMEALEEFRPERIGMGEKVQRESGAAWLMRNQSLPETVIHRMEALFQRARVITGRTGPFESWRSVLRIGTYWSTSANFHYDGGKGHEPVGRGFTILDVLELDWTYVAVDGGRRVIQLFKPDEAIVIDNTQTLHAYPAKRGRYRDPDRKLFRMISKD